MIQKCYQIRANSVWDKPLAPKTLKAVLPSMSPIFCVSQDRKISLYFFFSALDKAHDNCWVGALRCSWLCWAIDEKRFCCCCGSCGRPLAPYGADVLMGMKD